jgi:hypothetical protein
VLAREARLERRRQEAFEQEAASRAISEPWRERLPGLTHLPPRGRS